MIRADAQMADFLGGNYLVDRQVTVSGYDYEKLMELVAIIEEVLETCNDNIWELVKREVDEEYAD